MAFSSTTHWEVQTGGDDTNNGGGFDPSNASMATDLAATSATSLAPIVTSASYNFVSTDVGHWLYVKSGTNWKAGWYQISSVASNAATINATAGQWIDATTLQPSTTNNCATTGSPTGGTWSIDYSQAVPPYSYTDMVIDGTTNTKFTSSGHPVGKNLVGNVISITSGTGFTVQRVQVSSVSGSTATCDKSLGTLSSTGGNGKPGGSLATPGQAGALHISTNKIWTKSGNYTFSSSSNVSGGRVTLTSGSSTRPTWIEGYGSIRGDKSTKPVLKASASAMNIITLAGNTLVENLELGLSAGTETTVNGTSSGATISTVLGCKANGVANGFVWSGSSVLATAIACEALSCTTAGFSTGSSTVYFEACVARSCAIGFTSSTGSEVLINCIAANNTGVGFNITGSGGLLVNCLAYGNSGDGFGNSGADSIYTGCLAVGQTSSGKGFATTSWAILSNCAGYNNAGGDVPSTVPQQRNFITLTSDPFVNAASLDFTLNNTAGGGAALKAQGYPLSYSGLSTNNYLDIGSAQHQDTAMSGTKLTDITQLTAADVLDLLYLVDVSDTVDNAAGSSKRILVGDFLTSRSVSRGLFDHYANAGSVSTTETDLYSDSIPANTLSANGDGIAAEYGCILVNSTSTKQVKVYFGGTVIFDTGALTISASSEISIYISIIRVSSTVVRYIVSAATTGTSTGTYSSVGEITGLTLSNALILKITGTAAGVGAATNDIVAKLGKVIKYPAAA